MASISEFAESLDPWGIYDHKAMAEDYKRETGEEPCWPTHTVGQTKKSIAKRGLGGFVSERDGSPVVFGYEAVVAMADKYGEDRTYRTKVGRGFKAQHAIESLRKAGK